MRKLLLAGAAAAIIAGAADAQVITEWVLAGQPGNQPFTAASGSAANVAGLDLVRGAGIGPAAAADSFSGSGWNSLGADDYFSFGFTVGSGFAVQLDELWLGTRSSNTGPGFLGLFYSGDNFASNLHSFVQTGTAFTYSMIDLSGLGSLTGNVEFRVMALNDTAAGGGTTGSSGAFRFAEHSDGTNFTPVRFTGNVVPTAGLGTPYCFGDGSGVTCPCNNAGAAGEGCANSTGSGARLLASGSASASAADLVLLGSSLVPSGACVFFQGDAQVNGGVGVPFGDGLRCASHGVVRLQVLAASPGGNANTTVDLVAQGGVVAGDTRAYQIWYQDLGASPCAVGFNLSNGVSITFGP